MYMNDNCLYFFLFILILLIVSLKLSNVTIVLFCIIFFLIYYNFFYKEMSLVENFKDDKKFYNDILSFNDPLDKFKRKLNNLDSNSASIKRNYKVRPIDNYYNPKYTKPEEILSNPLYKSKNQALVGPANPKTNIAPVVVPPILDYNYWKNGNDFSIPSAINTRNVQDFYYSGYEAPVDCDEEEHYTDYTSRRREYQNEKEDYEVDVVENFYPPIYQKSAPEDGEINYTGYYNKNAPKEYDLPSNYRPINNQANKNMVNFNENIFTSNIQPGTSYRTEIIEPLAANIGISFDQQIPPRKKENGMYIAKDPTQYVPEIEPLPHNPFPSNYDVYDPRQNNYSDNTRRYIDPLTGQLRFFYDDVDAIRRPNFIQRSKVDFIEKASTYGPMESDRDISEWNKQSRREVEKDFLKNSIGFRNDLSMRQMRPALAQQWQNKLLPRSRAGNFTLGARKIN